MPGFVVGDLGLGASTAQLRPYYSYTWEIDSLFEEYSGRTDVGKDRPLIYAMSATFPTWNFTNEVVQSASMAYKFAKDIVWNDAKVSWYDTLGFAAIIKKWRESVWSPEAGIQPGGQYKRRSILRSLAFDWQDPIVWTLYNSWPSSVKTSDLSYAESAVKMVDVTITYDWAKEVAPDVI